MTRASQRVMNLAHMLRQAARRHPDGIALVHGERTLGWAELDGRVDALATVLAECGIAKGDRVLVQSRNSHQLVETMFACFRTGAVWVPTNFRQTPDEVAWLARSSGAKLMVCDAHFPDHAVACGISDVIVIGSGDDAGYDGLIDSHRGRSFRDADVEYDDPCWFFYTSGTTGRPKAAVLTHGQMAFVITNHLCDLMPGTTECDASLVVAPLTHGAGVHLLTQVARGAKTVLPAGDRFDAAEAWALVERWRVTNMFTVPTILKLLVEHPSVDRHDHGSLRHVIYAGAPMYRADQKRALTTLGPVLVQYFGLGEVTGAITVLRPEDHHAEDGPAVFAGYHDNDEANAKAFRNGWFRTGDRGHLDLEGDMFITGRASDMFISGGSNVYPREIEERILTHDAIDEVAVVGMADPVWGEIGVAVCVLRPGFALDDVALAQWLKGRIASYKIPRQIMFWDALPRSGYGKISKAGVKRAILDRSGVDAIA